MDSATDEAKKQYFRFSIIISLLISFFFNIALGPAIKDTPISFGFPLEFWDSGIGNFFEMIINIIVLFALLVVPIYYFLWWLEMRRGRW